MIVTIFNPLFSNLEKHLLSHVTIRGNKYSAKNTYLLNDRYLIK